MDGPRTGGAEPGQSPTMTDKPDRTHKAAETERELREHERDEREHDEHERRPEERDERTRDKPAPPGPTQHPRG